MSLRIRHLRELPKAIRESVAARLAKSSPVAQPEAAVDLRLAELRAERDRLVVMLLTQLRHVGLGSLFVREHRFHVERQWRLDLYAHSMRLGVEVHGGINDNERGRHIRAVGFMRDREKMNAAIESGIRVLEYWPRAISDGSALKQIESVIALWER